MQSKVFSSNKTLNLRGSIVDLTVPKVMGILNVTPDSFYDGGRYSDEKVALQRAEQMLQEGADLVDIGGYSTRPGANEISVAEEIKRVIPIIGSIVKHFPEAHLSVDTFRAETARQAILTGASIINDVSGGQMDPMMFATVAQLRVPYVLMHMRGTPKTMNQLTDYEDLVFESLDYFSTKISQLHNLGVKDVILDPGFGFAKTVDQNFELLQRLDLFKMAGLPILTGISRKSMIWRTLNTDASESLNGTTALHSLALANGASILRVHDVKEAVETVKLVEMVKNQKILSEKK